MNRIISKKSIALFLLLIIIVIVASCGQHTSSINDEEKITSGTQGLSFDVDLEPVVKISRTTERINFEHKKVETSLSVVGDIMFHNTQLFRAYDSETKTFSFDGIFEHMKPYLINSDLTFGNLETTLNGPYGSTTSSSDRNVYGYSGYPRFNTPDSLIDELVDSGFDFLSTANNHCLDRNYEGMINTIDKLDKAGIAHTGTFKSIEERKSYEIIEVNGISFAVVNYTYSTNGLYLSDENMKLVNNLEVYQPDLLEKLYSDIEAAEASDADFVIAMMHYGNEYQEQEDRRFQKPITYEIIRRGADIVFGGHPHVLQPVEIVRELDGVELESPKVIIYSLGNFISSQRGSNKVGGNKDLGVVFNVYLETIDGINPRITGIGFVPTYTLWQEDIIMTVPTNLDFSLTKLMLTQWDQSRIDFANEYTINHLLQYEYDSGSIGSVYEENGVVRVDLLD